MLIKSFKITKLFFFLLIQWELEHEGVHCERFQQWKDMHTPEPPPAGLVKFLIDRGISE